MAVEVAKIEKVSECPLNYFINQDNVSSFFEYKLLIFRIQLNNHTNAYLTPMC